MSVNHADIPDEIEQEAAVNDFFDSLDADDTSADALDAGTEAISEALEAPEEVEPAEDADEDSEEPVEAPEDAEDENSEEEKPEEEPEDDLDPVEKRIRNLQSLHDRQMHDMRAQLEALQTWAQNSYQHQVQQHQQLVAAQQAPQVQQNPLANVTPEVLKQGIETDLATTFRQIAAHRPDLMARTISMARETYGNETGEQMQLEYNNYLVQQQAEAQEAKWAALQAQQVEAQQPAQIEATMNTLVNDIADQYGDAFDAIRDDFIAKASESAPAFREYMDGRGLEMTPDAINYFLQKCVNDVREERIMKQASKPKRARKVAPSEHVETSTNGDGNRAEDMTADELAINELLEGAKELSIDTSRPTR